MPWLLPLAGAAVGGLASGAMAAANAGHNDFHATAPKVNADNFSYHGTGEREFGAMGDQAQNRGGVGMNMAGYDAGGVNSAQSRADAGDAQGLLRNAAYGLGPSAAQAQLRAGTDASIRAQQSMANSATGGALAASAAQGEAQAAGNQARMVGAQQAAQLRAQEMQQAQGQYAQMTMAQRTADLQAQGLSLQAAYQQAQLEDAQRGRNDAMTMGYAGLGQHASMANQQGLMGYSQLQSANEMGAQQINAGPAAGNAANDKNLWVAGMQGVGGGLQMGANLASSYGGGTPAPTTPTPPTAADQAASARAYDAKYGGDNWRKF